MAAGPQTGRYELAATIRPEGRKQCGCPFIWRVCYSGYVLVDKDGKLLSTGLRGEELIKKLAAMLAN